jgi:hypothetical protein
MNERIWRHVVKEDFSKVEGKPRTLYIYTGAWTSDQIKLVNSLFGHDGWRWLRHSGYVRGGKLVHSDPRDNATSIEDNRLTA